MIAEPVEGVQKRAQALHQKLEKIKGVDAKHIEHEAFIGGGSLPTEKVASAAVSLKVDGYSSDELASKLRTGEPSIFGRIAEDRFLLDCRTIVDDELAEIEGALKDLL